MIPAHSAPHPAFQAQRVVVLSGTFYTHTYKGDLAHSGRESIVRVH